MLELKRNAGKSKERFLRQKNDDRQQDLRLRLNGKEVNIVLPQANQITILGQFKGKLSPSAITQINDNHFLNQIKRSNKNFSTDKKNFTNGLGMNPYLSSSALSSLGKSLVEHHDSRTNYKLLKVSPKNILMENIKQLNGANSHNEDDDFKIVTFDKDKTESSLLSQQNSNAVIEGNKDEIAECGSEYALNLQGIALNLEIWNIFFDLELIGDSKLLINQLSRKFFRLIESMLGESLLEKVTKFSSNNLYPKIVKLQVITLIYIRFIFTDFNFESTLKTNLKRILNCINEALLLIYDNAVNKRNLPDDNENVNKLCQIIDAKLPKLHKHHKPQKSLKPKDLNSLVSKAIEACINSIKQFSK